MIAAYHLIWTIYGYWLPNDPRGSMSKTIRNDLLADLGTIHFERKEVQPTGQELRAFRAEASNLLRHEFRPFSASEIASVATAFGDVVKGRSYTCYACAIMPDHVHVLIRKHRDLAETMIAHLQSASKFAVLNGNERAIEHPIWGGPGWKVFLRTRDDIERVARYIELNPVKAKLPAQNWPFVTKYDGWMPGVV